MMLSDVSVRRPVFATVISLLLVIVGLMALRSLPLREYPDVSRPSVSVEVTYRGASAAVVESRIVDPLEQQLAGIPGMEEMKSESLDGEGEINMEFSLDTDVDEAANDVRARLGRIRDNLPEGAEAPEIRTAESGAEEVLMLTLTSSRLNALQITDYIDRYIVDSLRAIDGVSQVEIWGERRYAMRIWLDPVALAARGLTVENVTEALRAQNVELPAGRLESKTREFTLRAMARFDDVQDFEQLVIGTGKNGYLVRLGDVAGVELGSESLRNLARTNAEPAVTLAIVPQTQANPVTVSAQVRSRLDDIRATLPAGMRLEVTFDQARFIQASIHEVYVALGVSLALVLLTIYAFLGTLRATLIPAVVVPISLLASLMVMAALGYSLNVLTLLGLVLAIGLVVDDAIVVLENIYRRIEDGQPPLLAALDGSREIGFAVIATTCVLIAAFAPISFMGGEIGQLFTAFGVTMAAAVAFSALVALTLTPMMASKLFTGQARRSGFAHWVDARFRRVARGYEAVLTRALVHPWRMLLLALLVLLAAAALFRVLPSAYAPPEDRGVVRVYMAGPEGATMAFTRRYMEQTEAILGEYADAGVIDHYLSRIPGSWDGNAVNDARFTVMLAPWQERDRSAADIAAELRQRLGSLVGVEVMVYTSGGLAGGGNESVVMILGGQTYDVLSREAEQLKAFLQTQPGFIDIDSDYSERKPQMLIHIDRDRAGDLGLSVAAIGRTLQTMFGGQRVTTFARGGEEYDVIIQGRPGDRATPTDLRNLYVRSSTSGRLIPLGSVVTLEETAGANDLTHYNQLRSIEVTAGLAPGLDMGQAIDIVNDYTAGQLPATVRLNYGGAAEQYLDAGASLYVTLLLALLVVYLVLAANFESFVHPLVIMTTVPLAITGGLIGLWLWGISINIFSQIGAILLIGLAAKNGVLIVEFTNQLRDRGRTFQDAIIEASGIRLRPVLMTSLAAAFGALPLVLASGPGAEARRAVGVVVFSGVIFATFLTLFVVPAAYALLARGSKSPGHVSQLIRRQREEEEARGVSPVLRSSGE